MRTVSFLGRTIRLHAYLIGMAALLASFVGNSSADTIVANPVFGSGQYAVVPNGDFESNIGSPWVQQNTFGFGDIERNFTNPYSGNSSAEAVPVVIRFGTGYAIEQPISLITGETYVLSGFFNMDTLDGGELYIDLDDYNGEHNDNETGLHQDSGVIPDGWFFAYSEFVAPSSSVNVRVAHGKWGTALNRGGLVDEVAITPIGDFVPAVAIPEPTSLATCLIGMAGFFLRRTASYRNG